MGNHPCQRFTEITLGSLVLGMRPQPGLGWQSRPKYAFSPRPPAQVPKGLRRRSQNVFTMMAVIVQVCPQGQGAQAYNIATIRLRLLLPWSLLLLLLRSIAFSVIWVSG